VKALTAAKDWARNEQEWLRLNQPRDCYRDLHGVWSTVIGRLGEAFAVLESAFADGDMQELLRGQRLAEEVTVFMEQHAESAAPVLCAGAPAGEDVSTHGCGQMAALYSATAGRAALNDLRDWPLPCSEAP